VLGPWAAAQSSATAEYQVYALKNKAVAEVEKPLGEILARLGTTTHLVADARNNQLLLRGPDVAQQVARQFIASVDRSAPATPLSPPVVKAYPCGQMRASEMADRLRALCPNREQVRIAPDLDGGQVFVVAPAEVHAAIGQRLSSVAATTPQSPFPTAKPDELPTEYFLPLANVRVEQVATVLQNLVQPRLSRAPQTAGSNADLVYLDTTGRRVELRIDAQRNGMQLAGAASLVAQFARLIQSLDHPAPVPGRAFRVIPVRKASPDKIEEAIKAYQMGKGAPRANDSGQLDPARGGIGLVGYLFQAADDPSGKTPGARSAVQSIPATDAKAEQTRRVIRALGTDVEVEVLPDLDVIILRGRDRDVEEVTRIIEELERLSAETQPVVEVYPLKHVGGDALVTIITKINESFLGGRQGRVSLTPLMQPNALLMIGWGDAIKATKELLDKLDQPVAPEAEFRVFPLKHAPAAATQTVVQGFFANRTGLGSRVQATADPRTNSLIVQAAPRELDEAARLIEGLDRSESAAVSQTRIFKLKNSLAVDLATTLQAAIDVSRGSAAGAAAAKSSSLELITVDAQGQKLLKSGMLADVRVTADARLNNLLVTCPAESMELMAALIQQLDAPVSTAQIKVFRIVNGDAASLILMLRSLMVTSTTAGPQLGVAEGESTLAALRFSIDLRTNSIIAVGSPGDLKIVEALLLRLDEQDVQQRKNEVYRLKNAPAMDVANAVNEFLRSERQVQQAAPGTISPFQQIESEVVVVPEVVSNALIISATPRFFEEIHKLVLDLDAQPSQVLIQVLIAQVDLESFNEFGVELGLQDSILYDRGLLGTLASSTVTTAPTGTTTVKNYTGTPFNDPSRVGSSGLSSFNLGNTNSNLGFGGLVLSASSQSVSVLLRALEQNHCLEVLSRPQVMTLDNQPAFIQVGQRVPRIVGTAVNSVGSVNSITMENVGLILSVTPRISPEGMVVMEIDAEKSKVGNVDDGIPVSTSQGVTIKSPKIDVTTAQTTVSANSGDTIMLGGLITKERDVVDRRVPLLADIPILGNLFKYKQTTKNRSELLIILTPHVIRSSEDAERAKQIEVARIHWSLGDVVQMHGDIGVNCNNSATRASATVYPDSNPRGVLQKPSTTPRAPGEPEAVPTPKPTPMPGDIPWPKSSGEASPRQGVSRAGVGPTLRIVPGSETSPPAATPVSTAPESAPLQTVVPTAHFESAPAGPAPAAAQAIPDGVYPSTANLPISSYPQTPY
jgi:type II secretion system protein D